MTTLRPPRFGRWLLERILPPDMRDDVPGDFEELFVRKVATVGALRARGWYCWQVVSFAVHLLAERRRNRQRHFHMTLGISWIDFKLAVRMLARYPGLTAVGVGGMAVGIAIAAAAFAIGTMLLDPTVPLPEGDRVVALQTWNARTNNRESRVLHDFLSWRAALTSVQQVGAFRTTGRNLIVRGAHPETVVVAEISAAGFEVASTAPLLGRILRPDDERPSAPDVVVIGEEVWRRRFSSDPAILGRELQLGGSTHAIVGVMPHGFAFPVNHRFWIPLRLPVAAEPLTGPSLTVFGRLAPGATIAGAQAEIAASGERISAASPATHQHLRPRVVPYTHAFSDMDDPQNALALRAAQTLVVMLLALVCVNVAILVYARTATRQGEIAVRTALGASRRRIVWQLFLEALVLAGVAAVVGIGFTAAGLRQLAAGLAQLGAGLPFWMDFTLSTTAVVAVAGLTVLAAGIVGIVPALKATGRRVRGGLQGLSAGSGSRMQMGRMWTFLIVAQVAVAVALLPATVYHAWNALSFRTGDIGFATSDFLTADLAVDNASDLAPSPSAERAERQKYAARQAELERAIEAEAPVAAATFSLTSPGGELAAVLEAEGISSPVDPVDYNIVTGSKQGHFVRFNRIAVDFLDAYDVPLLMGRPFAPGDARSGVPVLVSRRFVERIFGGSNPLGRRIRYVGVSREAGHGNITLDRWHEIVGVVQDFPAYATDADNSEPRLYHPADPGDLYPATIAVRVRGVAASTFAGRLREIGARVDPVLQLHNISTVEDAIRREQGLMRLIGVTLAAVTLSVIALASAGIYALMSFTVARRRKEIGIRAALGADPRRILAGIFSRAFTQLGIGAVLGMLGAVALEGILEGEAFQGDGAIVLPIVALFVTVVGLLAAFGPARRGLQIQPTEALREE